MKVNKSEAIDAKRVYTQIDNSLISESPHISNVSKSITTFIDNTSDKLIGEGYNSIREIVLPTYNQLLDKREKCKNSISDIITNISENWDTFMGEYEALDTSLLDELYVQRDNIANALDNLYTRANKTTNMIAKARLLQSIEYYKGELDVLSKHINKLEKVKEQNQTLTALLNKANEAARDFSSSVNGLSSSIVGFSSIDNSDGVVDYIA